MEKTPLSPEEIRFFIDGKYYFLETNGMSREQAAEALKRAFPDAEIIENPPVEI